MSRLAIVCLAVVALTAAACRMGRPLLPASEEKSTTPGTIGGLLTSGNDALPGRRVHAVHIESGQRYSAVTSVTGGFSIPVPPGKYRLQVDLLEGETVVRDPGVVDINVSDLDANLEIVVRP